MLARICLGVLFSTATLILAADAPVPPKLWAGVSVSQPAPGVEEVTDAPFFNVAFALINDGDRPFAPTAEVNGSKLLVNGKELKDWPLVIGNGPREALGSELKPGESLRFGKAMGRYFAEPGLYRIQWKGKSFESAVVEFRVRPRQQ